MITRRRLVLGLGAGALAAPFASFAQVQGKIWRIGLLYYGSRQSMLDAGRYAALIEGLRERGYVEGKTMSLQARYEDGSVDRIEQAAADLLRLQPELILTAGTPTSQAASRITANIPIVVITTSDPVGEGLAATLARPGKNVTGLTTGGSDTLQKMVELLIVASPKLKRIAALTNPANPTHTANIARVQAAGKKAGKQIVLVAARSPGEIESGFATMARERAEALVIPIDGFMFQQRAQLAALALKHRLPSIYPTAAYAEVGGLMSYGADLNDNFRRAGQYVDKILKGAKPAELPFEQPTRYSLVINRKTANALGIKLTNELQLLAERVID